MGSTRTRIVYFLKSPLELKFLTAGFLRLQGFVQTV